jgi:hypothetical protein
LERTRRKDEVDDDEEKNDDDDDEEEEEEEEEHDDDEDVHDNDDEEEEEGEEVDEVDEDNEDYGDDDVVVAGDTQAGLLSHSAGGADECDPGKAAGGSVDPFVLCVVQQSAPGIRGHPLGEIWQRPLR